jgi:hypothetical protein
VEAILARGGCWPTHNWPWPKWCSRPSFAGKVPRFEEATAKAEEAVEKMAAQLVFGRAPAGEKTRHRRAKSEVKVVYFRSLPDTDEDQREGISPPIELPVQLAMFAM